VGLWVVDNSVFDPRLAFLAVVVVAVEVEKELACIVPAEETLVAVGGVDGGLVYMVGRAGTRNPLRENDVF
jgi:hypothetical protein